MTVRASAGRAIPARAVAVSADGEATDDLFVLMDRPMAPRADPLISSLIPIDLSFDFLIVGRWVALGVPLA